MNTIAEEDSQPSSTRQSTHRAKLFALAASIIAATGACGEAETAANDLTGLWRSRAYGIVAQVTPDDVVLIEHTPVSCLRVGKYAPARFLSDFEARPNYREKTFKMRHDGTLSTITFEALDPEGFDRLCPQGLTPRSNDPELNFEVLWHTFDEHYAFFSERKVDWDAVYTEFRPQISRKTTKKKLRRIFREILQRLGDAHVTLQIDGDDVVWVDSRLADRLLAECRKRRGRKCKFDDYLDERKKSFEKTLRSRYFDDEFKTAFKGEVIWGQIGKSTGYFRIDSMAGLVRGNHSSNDDLTALQAILDDVLEDLGDLPNMIVDVRLNGGGHDAVALAIASRFTDARRIFGSKSAFDKGRRTTQQDLVLEPADGRRYSGRVAVLTSSETASAAEVFVLAMRPLPQVTLVGEATMGIFSDELYRKLPNGWEVSLSNEIYRASDGALFEATGVPPDVFAPFLSLEDQQDGVDSVIEAAIRSLTASYR